MALTDHHPFPACHEFEYEAAQLHAAGIIALHCKEECLRWHRTVVFKLRCADYHFDELSNHITIAAASMGKGVPPDLFHLNRVLDSFLSCLYSAQDVFAKELNFVLGNPMAGRDPYNLTHLPVTLAAIAATRPAVGTIAAILQPALNRATVPLPPLLDIRDYRNASTHAMLIPTSEITLSTGGTGAAATGKLYLPDEADSLACTGRRDVGSSCRLWFRSQLEVFDRVYASVANEVRQARVIPLP